jgi:hypothetical protein
MKISDEKYEWLLKWNKKIAEEELLKDVQQEVASECTVRTSLCISGALRLIR